MTTLAKSVYKHFMSLPQDSLSQNVQAEYVWVSPPDSGSTLRSKTKTLSKAPLHVSDLPVWNFDGSSTLQAPSSKSEVLLYPCAFYPDPFRQSPHILVLCECRDETGQPISSNTRFDASTVFQKYIEAAPWYGLEQEYTLFESDNRTPLGWPRGGFPGPQGPYYCGVGTSSAFGRMIADAHYRACLYAGIKVSGINAEVMPGQWEFQVGPCEGIEAGDSLWMARYILLRIVEMFGVNVSFDPKPVEGDWNGAGCHVNFSTVDMRRDGGLKRITDAIKKLGTKHKEHIEVYGLGNERRLTGKHETADMGVFSFGVGDRTASVRIPCDVAKQGKGYLEDRRPASNMDPYIVTAKILETIASQQEHNM